MIKKIFRKGIKYFMYLVNFFSVFSNFIMVIVIKIIKCRDIECFMFCLINRMIVDLFCYYCLIGL